MFLRTRSVLTVLGCAAALLIGAGSASAAPKYQGRSHADLANQRGASAGKPRKTKIVRGVSASRRPVRRSRTARSGYQPRGYQPLYTDGHSVGFEPTYGPSFSSADRSRWRRGNALVETMAIDQGTRFNGYNYGLPFE